MDMIQDVLDHEYHHSLDVLDLYRKRLDSLPKGRMYPKKINGKIYYYLAYRDGKKVKTDYLGKLSDEEIKAMQEKIDQRKRFEERIKEVERRKQFLQKVLKQSEKY